LTGDTGPQGPAGPVGPAGASPWNLNGAHTNYTAGRVGIGTTTPLDSLHVVSGGNNAILAQSSNSNGNAVYALNTASSGLSFGVRGLSSSPTGIGTYGFGAGAGVQGESNSSTGVAVLGTNSGQTGNAFGVQGLSSSAAGTGVYGNGNLNGVWAETNNVNGRAVFASNAAVTGVNYGVYSQASSSAGTAVFGTSPFTGVQGIATGSLGRGMVAKATASTGASFGLFATNASDQGTAIYGRVSSTAINGNTRYALFAEAPVLTNSWAGWFAGNVNITGSIFASSKSFRIDHPLDPERKYLNHVSMESPEMKTFYDGIATLGPGGRAWVEMPDYFEALNGDCRYQLTCVGGYAPVYIAAKVKDGRFEIAGGFEGLEVSWTVTGVRRDPWANKNRVPVEEPKTGADIGKFLAPEAYGKPESMRVAPSPEMPAAAVPVRVEPAVRR
jgi:hypothetical protein